MSFNKAYCLAKIGQNVFRNQRVVCLRHWQFKKNFSSEAKGSRPAVTKNFNQPPLNESLSDLPSAVYSNAKLTDSITRVSSIGPGIRVATEDHFGQFCTVGVLIDCGSRHELAYPKGISHFLEKLAFNSSLNYENKDAVLQELEKYGGICDCRTSRDAFIYAASVVRDGLEAAVKILGDAVLRPKLSRAELKAAQETIEYELSSLETKPEQDLILMDMVHAAAFRNNTLGLPKFCPKKNLFTIERDILFTFMKNHYTPYKIIVTGVGVDHDKLVDLTRKYFIEQRPIWEQDKTIGINEDPKYLPAATVANYTGGLISHACEIPSFPGPSGLPELAHVVIGMEGVSFTDEDFIPLCVLNMMMGGGGSFSAGGPGKGMYSRLYLNVLNKYPWLFSATAYNHSYMDSGLFCVHVSATPEYVGQMTEVTIKELINMTNGVHPNELRRAQKQLQSLLLMNLESKPVVFEDIARQVMANGFRKKPDVFIGSIGRVTEEDILRVANRLFGSPPAIAARGNVAKLPKYQDIQKELIVGAMHWGEASN